MAHTHDMSKRDWTALGRYVRALADDVGLRDWWIDLMHDPPLHNDALATCTPTFGRKLAQVHVCHEFRHLEPVKQRWILVHELLHCHFAATQDMVRGRRLEATLGELVHGHFSADWMQAHEYAIDAIACEWAKSLPLIAWPR